MPKSQAGYKYLLTYQYASVIYDLTVEFCDLYIDRKSRTHDQMTQASRSGKQNIAEGYEFASLKGYIKLAGVAKGSLVELTEDYEDFLRQRKLKLWDKNDPRVLRMRELRVMRDKEGNFSLPRHPQIPQFPHIPHDPELAANQMLTLCNKATYLLDRQIKALEEKFVNEGGYTEKLFRKRLARRNR